MAELLQVKQLLSDLFSSQRLAVLSTQESGQPYSNLVAFAQTDDLIVSVNTIILQYIEHLDQHGCYGNMIDVLSALISAYDRGTYPQNSKLGCSPPLIKNSPLSVLMCPPEHRQALQPVLDSISAIRF